MINKIAAAGVVLATGVLSACSSSGNAVSSSGDYCGDLKATQAYFKALGSADGTADYAKLKDSFGTLSLEAPSSLKSDWSQLTAGITAIDNAFKAAGIKPSDLRSAASLPPEKLKKFEEASKSLSADSAKLETASQHIEADAKSRCNVVLSS